MEKLIAIALLVVSGFAVSALAEDAPTAASAAPANVKYKGAKDLNFEQLLIEGALKRPELSVVTGDRDQDTDGLLRLRENFLDRMTVDASEEIP